jgi:hypothetical protein
LDSEAAPPFKYVTLPYSARSVGAHEAESANVKDVFLNCAGFEKMELESGRLGRTFPDCHMGDNAECTFQVRIEKIGAWCNHLGRNRQNVVLDI